MPATSLRRDSSERRSASAASRCHIASRATRRPSRSPAGTVTAATTRHTTTVSASWGVYMNPLTPSTPTSAAASGTSTSATIVAVSERRRIRSSTTPPTTATGRENNSASGAASNSPSIIG